MMFLLRTEKSIKAIGRSGPPVSWRHSRHVCYGESAVNVLQMFRLIRLHFDIFLGIVMKAAEWKTLLEDICQRTTSTWNLDAIRIEPLFVCAPRETESNRHLIDY